MFGIIIGLSVGITAFLITATNLKRAKKDISLLNADLKVVNERCSDYKAELAASKMEASSLKDELNRIGSTMHAEFESIAGKIFDTKAQKLTDLNRSNIKDILDPLGQRLEDFKKAVYETYDKESKERFSLGERVKELAQLNRQISEEANNLTKALKGDAKTQGGWGELILESILEKSGLRKNEEYFLQHTLTDIDDNPLRSDRENKKMRPDAVIKYPDNRSVIIDSKVSLNAFSRYVDAQDPVVQKAELAAHVAAVKARIMELSTKGYDDYDKSLDFVMMFIPSEPAYIAAQKGDPDLWNFAYEKRILLINPTNLIVSLKLIVDLWKREYQNRNAQDIADRGAKLYDKLAGFVSSLEDVGNALDKSKEAYDRAHKQLCTGNDNLIHQSEKLRKLGLKTKKTISEKYLRIAADDTE